MGKKKRDTKEMFCVIYDGFDRDFDLFDNMDGVNEVLDDNLHYGGIAFVYKAVLKVEAKKVVTRTKIG